MKLNLCTFLFVLVSILSSCDSENNAGEGPNIPGPVGGDNLPANCNVELVSAIRITPDAVNDRDKIGDYIFTLKSVKTEKEKISVEGRYAKNGTAASIVTVTVLSVGIDETIEIKIRSEDIKSEEDFDCMEYVIKVEAKDTRNCEWVGTDC